MIPKYFVPILAEIKKTTVTDKMERKINIQDCGSNNFRRFQIGGVLEGYFENQYRELYLNPGAQIATSPREW